MNAGGRQLPRLDVVIGNNFGHLPMFVGAEKGIFKNHGIDAHMKVVDTGTDMVNTRTLSCAGFAIAASPG